MQYIPAKNVKEIAGSGAQGARRCRANQLPMMLCQKETKETVRATPVVRRQHQIAAI